MSRLVADKKGRVKRFSLFRVIEHQLNAVTFIVLVLTGLAQRFHESGWAEWLILHLGGIDTTRWIHRGAGVMFAIVLFQHLLVGIYLVVVSNRPASMMVNRKDFSDAIENLSYYFGIRKRPARCDRYETQVRRRHDTLTFVVPPPRDN